jgi:hypothetical protein
LKSFEKLQCHLKLMELKQLSNGKEDCKSVLTGNVFWINSSSPTEKKYCSWKELESSHDVQNFGFEWN